jgi:hypothetical protein
VLKRVFKRGIKGLPRPQIKLSGRSVLEGSPAGTLIGNLSVNAPGTWTFALADDAGDRAAVSGDEIQAGAVEFDYEDQSSWPITVTAARVGDGLEIQKTFTILVIDVVENDYTAGLQFDDERNAIYGAALFGKGF